MQRIRIPPPLQSKANQLALRQWSRKRGWDQEKYFNIVDVAIGACKLVEMNPDHKFVAEGVAFILSRDQDFEDYVHSKNQIITDQEAWSVMCQAAAWIIIQKYHLVAVREQEEEEQ